MERKEVSITYYALDGIDSLPEKDRDLVLSARATADDAYAPYSKFYVGAAVRLENGEVCTGNNQENVSFPTGLCAERVALFAASSQNPGLRMEALAVYAHTDQFEMHEPVSPCGSCRQVMNEFEMNQGTPMTIYLLGKNDKIIKLDSASSLLPLLFKELALRKE